MNMQTPKGRSSSVEVSKKTSPATPRTTRKLKSQGSDSEFVNSPSSKTVKDRSTDKVMEHLSPRSPAIKKKCPTRVSELESQLVQLQTELKKTKEQLGSSESLKHKAQLEAEEARRHLAATSKKLEETQKQLEDIADSEEARLKELRKISQDRDRAWQSELEAVQKQNSMDSAALASAMNEVQRLRVQLNRVAESEAAQAWCADSSQAEVQNLRMELTKTLSLVEELKSQLTESKESGEKGLEEIRKAQMQLEVSKITEGTLQTEILQATDAYKSLAFELEQSQNRASKFEEICSKLQKIPGNTDQALVDASNNSNQESGEHRESHQLRAELSNLKLEAEQLRTALETAESRYQEEYIQGTLWIRSAYELVESSKADTYQREAKLEVARADTDKLKNELMEKELQLQNMLEENKVLNQMVVQSQSAEREGLVIELEKCKSFLAELNTNLLLNERELHRIIEENDMLKLELQKRELDRAMLNADSLNDGEAARASEQEAPVKLGYLSEDADNSSVTAAHVIEQLDEAQASNSEMEAELRRLKVQVDQWRKAAEAAASMLLTGNNDKYDERTVSLDNHTLGGKLCSPYFEDMDDESPKKKNGNMLKKIGTLLKKK